MSAVVAGGAGRVLSTAVLTRRPWSALALVLALLALTLSRAPIAIVAASSPQVVSVTAPSTVYAAREFYLNVTLSDPSGVNDLANATVTIGSVVLRWEASTNTFSVQSDPNNLCYLNAQACSRTVVDGYTVRLSFRLALGWAFPEGQRSVSVTATDLGGASASYTASNLFYFEDDLVVTYISVDDSRVNPMQNITVTGKVYYEGTNIAPSSGATPVLKVNGQPVSYRGGTIMEDGTFQLVFEAPTAVGSYTLELSVVTDEPSLQSQSTTIIVDKLSVTLARCPPGWSFHLLSWPYRKAHEVVGSTAGAVTDYPIRIRVYYGSGTDSGENVYLNGKCRADFGDVRFAASDGTLLSYWMESKVDGQYADFWVKVPSIPASPGKATIYIYYGNPQATRADNPLEVGIWQVREHQVATGYYPKIAFLKYGAGTVWIDSYTAGASSYGEGYLFITAPRSYLHGKKVQIYWDAYADTSQTVFFRVIIVNTELHRAQSLPTNSITNIFQWLVAAVYSTTTTGWSGYKITTSGVLDLSSFTSSYVTLLICLPDHSTTYSTILEVDWVKILDANNNVLMTFHFTEDLIMEVTNTYEDYGVVRKRVSPEPSHGAWGSEAVNPRCVRVEWISTSKTVVRSGEPLNVSLRLLRYSDGQPVVDATVTVMGVQLSHQGNGVYSGAVTLSGNSVVRIDSTKIGGSTPLGSLIIMECPYVDVASYVEPEKPYGYCVELTSWTLVDLSLLVEEGYVYADLRDVYVGGGAILYPNATVLALGRLWIGGNPDYVRPSNSTLPSPISATSRRLAPSDLTRCKPLLRVFVYDEHGKLDAREVTVRFPTGDVKFSGGRGHAVFESEEQLPSSISVYVSQNVYRKYLVRGERVDVYLPPSGATVALYSLTFIDYAGLIKRDSAVEVYSVAGALRKHLVSSDLVSPAVKAAAFWLTYGYSYAVVVRSGDAEHEVALVLADDSTSKKLYLYPQKFEEWVKLVYKYVRVNAYREVVDGQEYAVVDYDDSSNATERVEVRVLELPSRSLAYSTTMEGNRWTLRYAISREKSYAVELLVHHELFVGGSPMTVRRTLEAAGLAVSVPNVFRLPGASTGIPLFDNVLLVVLLIAIAGSFGSAHASVGLVLTLLLAGLFVWLGWLDLTWSALGFLIAMAVVYVVTRSKRW